MANSCVFNPSVRTADGEIKGSKLFPKILNAVNNDRKRAIDIYFKTKSEKFKSMYGSLPKDSNGEFLLTSVIKAEVFSDLTLESAIANQKIQKGFSDKSGNPVEKDATIDNMRASYEAAAKYNEGSEDFIAIPKTRINNDGKNVVYVDIEHRTLQNQHLVAEIDNEIKLHNLLLSNLREQGIAVGNMTDLEERLIGGGITKFTNLSTTTTDGLITLIRLGKGEKGLKALPEEFSHFVIETCTDDSLVDRLIRFVQDEDTLRTILGDDYSIYYKKYDGNLYRMAHEAAAKLLAIHLKDVFKSSNNNEQASSYATSVKSLLNRVWTAIKNIFSKYNRKSLEDILEYSKKLYSEAANKALKGELGYNIEKAPKEDWFNISTPQSTVADRRKGLLVKILENQTKRYNIAEKRVPEAAEQAAMPSGGISITGQQTGQTSGYTRTQRELKERIEANLVNGTLLAGVYDFLSTSFKGMKSASDAIDQLQQSGNLAERSARLNKARDFIYSYNNILSEIETELTDNPDSGPEYAEAMATLKEAFSLIRKLRTKYDNTAKSTFEQFILPHLPNIGDNPFTGEARREFLGDGGILWSSDKDISVYDAWLRAASNSSNEVIRLLDSIIKKARERGRQQTIAVRKRLEALGMKARNAGIKDFEWMLEEDSEGHKSGNYIGLINYAEYERARKAEMDRLKGIYDLTNPQEARQYWINYYAWINRNTEDDIPKVSIYENKVYTGMSQAQRDFYDEFTSIKEELDALLPLGTTNTLNAVKIRKDLLERMMSGGKMTEQIAEAIKDRFIRRSDDTDIDYEEAVEDFEGRRVNSLPIYYLHLREGESADDMSTDVISTMIAYAAMANDFYEMNGILQQMELGRDLLLDKESGHKIGQTKGDKPVVETITRLGEKIQKQLTKSNTKFEDRLNNLYEMSLYSRRRKDEGTWGKIDKGKLADELNSITALNTLALNLTAGITNLVTGTSMLRIEAAAKEFMEYKDVLRGDRAYALAMPEFFKEYGNSVKTNKLSLFDEMFNVMQEYEGQIKNTNFDRKKWYSRMFEMDTLFFMNNCGEHWLQNRTALGLAYAYKMKDDKGNETNLWDALKVEYIDEQHPEYGAKLVIKEGYTKLDGSEFSDDDIYEFTRKAAAINQRMHGIYNKEDMNVAQSVGLGRMALLFRKYLVPSVDRRFRKAIYNYDLRAWEEGYYNTAGKFLLQLGKDLKSHKLNIALAWNNLSDAQKANIKRAGTEVGYLLAIIAGIALLGGGDVDRKSRSFFLNELELQLKRQRAEIGSLVPSPMLANEALKIIKSPAAGVDTIEDMLGTLGILNPWNWTTEMQSGRYKGHSRAYKIFMTSPFVPMNSTIYKSLNPEEIIPFYNQ